MSASSFEARLREALRAERRLGGALASGDLLLSHRVLPGAGPAVAKLIEARAMTQCLAGEEGVRSLHLLLLEDCARLLLCSALDPPAESTLARLVDRCRVPLDRLWSRCEGFPDGGVDDASALAAFLAAGRRPVGYRYDAYPSASVRQIRTALDWMRKTLSYQIELAKTPRQ